jgi:hypothetical protein
MAKFDVSFSINKKGGRTNSIKRELEEKLGMNITIVKKNPNPSRAERLSEAEDLVSQAKDIVQELQDEMQNWNDNMPENLQQSDKAQQVSDAADNLQLLYDDLDNVDFSIVEFPGLY